MTLNGCQDYFFCRYARKHFSNSSDHLLKDIQQAMGLLAFDPSTRIKRYQKLFSLTRWEGLIDQFRQENFALYQLSQRSVLSVTLQAGLSALKTPYPPSTTSIIPLSLYVHSTHTVDEVTLDPVITLTHHTHVA